MFVQPVPALDLQEWRARKQKAEEQLASAGRDRFQLTQDLEQSDTRLNTAMASRDACFKSTKRVTDGMHKLGVGLLVAGVLSGFAGGNVTAGLVIGGGGVLVASAFVNVGLVLVLTHKDEKLKGMASDRLSVLNELQKVTGAEQELKAYDEAVGETERLLDTLKKPTNSIGCWATLTVSTACA